MIRVSLVLDCSLAEAAAAVADVAVAARRDLALRGGSLDDASLTRALDLATKLDTATVESDGHATRREMSIACSLVACSLRDGDWGLPALVAEPVARVLTLAAEKFSRGLWQPADVAPWCATVTADALRGDA